MISSVFLNAAPYIRRIFAAGIRRALPCRCALCDTLSPEPLCAECTRAYWPSSSAHAILSSRCAQCAYPLVDTKPRLEGKDALLLCGQCLSAPPAFDATLALADYAAPLDELVLALKFKSQLALASLFAQRLAIQAQRTVLNSDRSRPDWIIPVPLFTRRLIVRGYNQAWEITRPLARALGLRAHATLLTRITDTPPQQLLSAKARHRNMRGAFVVPPTHRTSVHGCHIAIVDDVMTSGATLGSAAQALKRAGAVRVTNLVVLRTPK